MQKTGLSHKNKGAQKETLPRMVFVSDMGDAFTRRADFEFLKTDTMTAIDSEQPLFPASDPAPGSSTAFTPVANF